ncbi:MAG: hypothetical protein ACRDK2_04790 [Solirubrobacteraceae bacterium]
MNRLFGTVLGSLTIVASTAALAGCGSQAHTGRAETEVRTLFAAIAANGRAHRFASICEGEMTATLKQLDYLVGGNCSTDLGNEWTEGVQLTSIGPHTHIVISGDTATVFDGPAPDRALRVNGTWKLAEFPRNKRFNTQDEAHTATETVNKILLAHHHPAL